MLLFGATMICCWSRGVVMAFSTLSSSSALSSLHRSRFTGNYCSIRGGTGRNRLRINFANSGSRPDTDMPTRAATDEELLGKESVVDLWVAGAGVLGSSVLQRWRPASKNNLPVVGETRASIISNNRLPISTLAKISHRHRHQRSDQDNYSCDNVLISFPPSFGSNSTSGAEYLSEVRSACRLWNPTNTHNGKLVLISSTAVYGNPGDVVVNELSDVDSNGTERSKM
jgi:hypothetical protein